MSLPGNLLKGSWKAARSLPGGARQLLFPCRFKRILSSKLSPGRNPGRPPGRHPGKIRGSSGDAPGRLPGDSREPPRRLPGALPTVFWLIFARPPGRLPFPAGETEAAGGAGNRQPPGNRQPVGNREPLETVNPRATENPWETVNPRATLNPQGPRLTVSRVDGFLW